MVMKTPTHQTIRVHRLLSIISLSSNSPLMGKVMRLKRQGVMDVRCKPKTSDFYSLFQDSMLEN